MKLLDPLTGYRANFSYAGKVLGCKFHYMEILLLNSQPVTLTLLLKWYIVSLFQLERLFET